MAEIGHELLQWRVKKGVRWVGGREIRTMAELLCTLMSDREQLLKTKMRHARCP